MESHLKTAIMNHLQTNSLLNPAQHGFLPGKSTLTNLTETYLSVLYALNSNAHVDVLLLDLSKAFDSVPHFRLLSNLESYGISGRILEWIKSFLSNRSQCVFLDSCSSSFKNVLSGVPQGSVLGPILFVIYLHDCFTRLHHTLPACYADDTKLVCSLLQRSFIEVGLDFREVENWSKEWLLQINSQKSFILCFGRNNPLNSYSLNGIYYPR